MLSSSVCVLLCSPTATGTAVQLGARTPPTALHPTWAFAAPPPPPRGHADHRRGAGSHPSDSKPQQWPLLVTHKGKTLLQVPAEGGRATTTQQLLENLHVREEPGPDLNRDQSDLDSTGTELNRNMPIMGSKIT